MASMIPVSRPLISKSASKYLQKSVKAGWISYLGPYVEKFESNFAKFVGTKYAVSTNSGTAALHLALASLDIGPGDEVIAPAFTMIATILPIFYLGAKPILVDVELSTGNIDVNLIEKKITKKTKAIMPVHMYGHPAEMKSILRLAKKHKLAVIEDAAEAHGAKFKMNGNWKMVGGLGNVGCFSFYANKIITTGEGGMAVTNDKKLYERIKSMRNLARTPGRHFLHQEVAFAYRMSSLQASLGLSQLEQARKNISKKLHIANLYTKLLKNVPGITLPIQEDYAKSVFWLYGILVDKTSRLNRDELAKFLTKKGIETRDFHYPMHQQPAFLKAGLFKNQSYPVSESLAKIGLCLPSGPNITNQEVNFVCQQVRSCLSSR